MSVSFDWEFAIDEEAPSRPADGAPPSGQRRRWLLRGVILFILLAIAGLSVHAWVNSRLDAVRRAEAELRGVVELELKSIAGGDGELFRSRQDPTAHRWQARQVARYISNPAAGSTHLPSKQGGAGELAEVFTPAPWLRAAERPPEIRKVRVSGHTGRAELTRWFQSLSYTSTLPSPVPFRVTWFYRRDEDGIWYHTPPPEGHWGAHHSWHGIWLDIHATEAEAEVLDPIASDLAQLVSNGCRRIGCPEDDRYILSFDDALAPHVRGNRWTLPALYLTGLPEDEDALAVWQRALELWLVEALAQAQLDGADVTGRVIYRQLVVRLQAELGLREPVSPDVELLTAALAEGKRHALQSLWQAEYIPGETEKIQLFEAEVAALLQILETQVGLERLFALLPALHRHGYFDSVLPAVYDVDPDDFEAAWTAYLSELTGVAAVPEPTFELYGPAAVQPLEPPPAPTPPTIPFGDQIALICNHQVWVGNLDGGDMAPLTPAGQHFGGVFVFH
jgi:hypothetical protein